MAKGTRRPRMSFQTQSQVSATVLRATTGRADAERLSGGGSIGAAIPGSIELAASPSIIGLAARAPKPRVAYFQVPGSSNLPPAPGQAIVLFRRRGRQAVGALRGALDQAATIGTCPRVAPPPHHAP